MCDRPLAVDFAEAEGLAKPQVNFLSAYRRRRHPVEAVAEGHVIARREVQVVNFVANRALKRREPLLQALLVERIVPRLLKGRRKGEFDAVRRILRHHAIGVLGS